MPSIDTSTTTSGHEPLTPITSRPGPTSKRQISGLATKLLHLLEDQWFLLALGILITIASRHQVPDSQQDVKEVVISYLCVSIIFLVTGLTLDTHALVLNYTRWPLHLFVQVQCFLLTSSTIFGVVSACASNRTFLDPALLIGLILAGCLPTTIASNVVMTSQAHGNTVLTVVQSTIGNFLGPFITPLLFKVYTSTGAWYTSVLPNDMGDEGNLYRRVFKQLGLSIFLPMAVGQTLQHLFPKVTKTLFSTYHLSKLGSVSLLLILWSAYDSAFSSGAFASTPANNMVFVVFVSIALFLLFLALCLLTSLPWLPAQDVIAVAYCVPAKTPAIGIPLSQVLFMGVPRVTKAKIQIPMVIYQGLQVAAGSVLTTAFRRWIDRRVEKAKPTENEETTEAGRQAAGR